MKHLFSRLAVFLASIVLFGTVDESGKQKIAKQLIEKGLFQ
jgi:hypothetical protein